MHFNFCKGMIFVIFLTLKYQAEFEGCNLRYVLSIKNNLRMDASVIRIWKT